VQIKRRHVIYVQGYDPRGLAEYYRMFRGEYRRSCELYGLKGEIGRPSEDSGRFATTWDIDTRGGGWHVKTTYEFLRWEHIIRKDFERPAWWKLAHMIGVILRTVPNGVLARIMRANWRFGLLLVYPIVLLLIFTLFSFFLSSAALVAASTLRIPFPMPLFAGLSVAIGTFIFLLRSTEPQTYLLYLCDDMIATRQYALRRRPDWEERMQVFAEYVVEAARAAGADEIVIVGHSSGSFLAVDVLTRALALDPDLGKHGPRVALLTVGANLPIVGFQHEAQWFRDKLAKLAVEPSIFWVDYQSRKDVMNFFAFDPITAHGIDAGPARRNPAVVQVRFRDIIKPENYARFRRHFFELHFQFIKANQRLGAAYDYYMICCGPTDLATRAARPDEAIAAVKA
jgi:pimeloyl-ACP methyl ester carboxylesterase